MSYFKDTYLNMAATVIEQLMTIVQRSVFLIYVGFGALLSFKLISAANLYLIQVNREDG